MTINRLEIGSGGHARPGFVHLDIEGKHNPDIVGDFRMMSFENLDEILALHILEHFGRNEAIEVLKQWHSWLRVGGRLIVETPDFERICGLFATPAKRLWADREHLNQSAYGSQEAEWAFHKDGWWREKFEQVLPELGYNIIRIWQKHSYIRYGEGRTRYRLPDIRVIAEKNGLK